MIKDNCRSTNCLKSAPHFARGIEAESPGGLRRSYGLGTSNIGLHRGSFSQGRSLPSHSIFHSICNRRFVPSQSNTSFTEMNLKQNMFGMPFRTSVARYHSPGVMLMFMLAWETTCKVRLIPYLNRASTLLARICGPCHSCCS